MIKNHIVLFLIIVVTISGCRTFSPGELQYRTPIGASDGVEIDSISVAMEQMSQIELSYVFDAQFQGDHNISACRLCIVNNTDEDATLHVLNVPNYIIPDKASSRSRRNVLSGIGVGLLGGLLLPFVMTAVDTTHGAASRYLSKTGFTVSLALGGVYGIGDMVASIEENRIRNKHIAAQSSDRYTVGARRQNCMVLFFDERVSERIPKLKGQAFRLSDSLAQKSIYNNDPAIIFKNEESGKGILLPLSY